MRISVCSGLEVWPSLVLPHYSASWWVTNGSWINHNYRGWACRPWLVALRGSVCWRATKFDFCLFKQIVNVLQEGGKGLTLQGVSGPELEIQ